MGTVIIREEKPVIFLVETDALLARMFLRFWQSHYQVNVIMERILQPMKHHMVEETPDIIIVDADINIGSFDTGFITALRHHTICPILAIASLNSAAEEIALLDAGADGCIAKPIDIHLLNARMQAMLRQSMAVSMVVRSELTKSDSLHHDDVQTGCFQKKSTVIGDLMLYPVEQRACLQGRDLRLTTGEFALLSLLAENAGQPIDRDQLSKALLGRNWNGMDRTVDQRVKRLRSKLGDTAEEPQYIRSVRGTGYMMIPSFG